MVGPGLAGIKYRTQLGIDKWLRKQHPYTKRHPCLTRRGSGVLGSMP